MRQIILTSNIYLVENGIKRCINEQMVRVKLGCEKPDARRKQTENYNVLFGDANVI
jgi:hypothetical protein